MTEKTPASLRVNRTYKEKLKAVRVLGGDPPHPVAGDGGLGRRPPFLAEMSVYRVRIGRREVQLRVGVTAHASGFGRRWPLVRLVRGVEHQRGPAQPEHAPPRLISRD